MGKPRESSGKRTDEISKLETKIKSLADDNIQLTSISRQMVTELEILQPYREKCNELMSEQNKLIEDKKKLKTIIITELDDMRERLNKEMASKKTAQQRIKSILEKIEFERKAHAKQMTKCYEQYKVKINKIRKQMSENLHELYKKHQNEVIYAKEMAHKAFEEIHVARKKINAKNGEIAELKHELSCCLANINVMKAKVRHLKRDTIKNIRQYPFVIPNNQMDPCQIGKRKYPNIQMMSIKIARLATDLHL